MEQKEVTKSERALELLYKYLDKELVDFIQEPTDKSIVESRVIGGGGKAKYVRGVEFTKRLNEAFGFLWGTRILDVIRDGDEIVVQGEVFFKIPGRKITRIASDGTTEILEFSEVVISKAQFGGSEVKRYARPTGKYKAGDMLSLASDYKAAATDMKKRGAVEMGFFLDVYSDGIVGDDDEVGESDLKTLYERGNRAGMDKEGTDSWVETQLGKKVEDCGREELNGLGPALIRIIQSKGKS